MSDLVLREKAVTPNASGRYKSNLYGKLAATGVVALALFAYAAQPAAARGMPESFADLAEQVSPAVVNIVVEKNVTNAGFDGEGMPQIPEGPEGDLLKRFFGDRMPQAPQGPQHATGMGSGFIVDADGYVVTNHHVIDGADKITVTFADGDSQDAVLIGSDPRTDLALLKIESDGKLPHVDFGESDDIRVGDWVMAVGNPFGLGGTVTVGVVSARGRDLHDGNLVDFVQIDAPINRGNSGGPTFNEEGEVIGINTAIFSPSGGSVGIGFAIPSDDAEQIIADLKDDGHVTRGWLGVRIQPVTEDIAKGFGLDEEQGALVAKVEPDSPAERAGMKTGDVILSWNGEEVERFRDLPRFVASTDIDKTVDVTVWRNRAETTLSVVTGALEEEQTASAEQPAIKKNAKGEVTLPDSGMTLALLDEAHRRSMGIDDDVEGVLVVAVEPGSKADEAGFSAGDIISSVNMAAVDSPAAVEKAVEQGRESGLEVVPVLVSRAGDQRFVSLSVEAA
ncbi:MAG TPA: DegQ family serine endoprotease [Kiloniellaceae bacterium]|nr:DegQ family serine endoprotease [Kiloniellaceae bacterium]